MRANQTRHKCPSLKCTRLLFQHGVDSCKNVSEHALGDDYFDLLFFSSSSVHDSDMTEKLLFKANRANDLAILILPLCLFIRSMIGVGALRQMLNASDSRIEVHVNISIICF